MDQSIDLLASMLHLKKKHTTTKHTQVRPPCGAGGDPTRLRLSARPLRRGAGPGREGRRGGGQGVMVFGCQWGMGGSVHMMDGSMYVYKGDEIKEARTRGQAGHAGPCGGRSPLDSIETLRGRLKLSA